MLRIAFFFAVATLLALPARAQNYAFSTLAGADDPGPVDGPASVARFELGALASDAAGNVFFGDPRANTIRKISPDGTVSTFAGASGTSGYGDGPLTTARFSGPQALAFDANGNLYVADDGNFVVRKIAPDGTVSTLAGRAGTQGEIDGAGGAARFGYLQGLAVDGHGIVFVGDQDTTGTCRIRRITPDGVVSTAFVAAANSPLATPFSPAALAFDRAGNLYIADSAGNTIREITSAGDVTVLAGRIGLYDCADGKGDAARFSGPDGIVVEANQSLLVADRRNRLIRRITPDGTVTSIAGQPERENGAQDGIGGNALFYAPDGLALDPAGNLYVADGYQSSVLRKGVPTANPLPPILTTTPAKAPNLATWSNIYRNVGALATVTFRVQAAGTGPFTYQWLRDGAAISGATDSTYTIASAAAADQGSYTVQVTNTAGTYTPLAVKLSVYTPPFGAFTVRHSNPGGSWLWGITSGGGRLVAVGANGEILTSDDGQTWTTRSSGTTEWLVDVTYAAGEFIAVGDHGVILTSADGATWSAVPSGTVQRLNGVGYGAGRWVIVGQAGTILTSTDAQTWTLVDSGMTTWLRGIVYLPSRSEPPYIYGDNGTGKFYVSGEQGTLLEGDGVAWKKSPVTGNAISADIETLTLGPVPGSAGEGPIGVGEDGVLTYLQTWYMYAKGGYRLPDGTWVIPGSVNRVWQQSAIGLTARFRGLVRGAGAIFATGENGIIAAAQQIGGPWSFIPSGTTSNLVAGVFYGNSLYVVGDNETIVQSVPLYNSRLVNLSARGYLRDGNDPLICGVVVSGTSPKNVLLRAPGPALRDFGVADALAAPTLTLFDVAGHPIATNRGWGTTTDAADISAAATRLGAYPFADGSADSALLVRLQPGSYTAHVTATAAGTAMLEAYDADDLSTDGAREVNISTRGWVGSGDQKLIAGFVISGAASRRVLVRGIGPSLSQYGVAGALAQPQLELFQGQAKLQSAGAWSVQPNADDIRAAAVIAGAFPLADGSSDAAIIMTLAPGSYTAQISGAANATGAAMIEVYDLP